MNKFNYEGFNKGGITTAGIIEAATYEEATQKLREAGIFVNKMTTESEPLNPVLEHKLRPDEPSIMERTDCYQPQPAEETRFDQVQRIAEEYKEKERQRRQYLLDNPPQVPIPKESWEHGLDAELNAWGEVMNYTIRWLMAKNDTTPQELLPLSLHALQSLVDRSIVARINCKPVQPTKKDVKPVKAKKKK